jgi:hypothetical protein
LTSGADARRGEGANGLGSGSTAACLAPLSFTASRSSGYASSPPSTSRSFSHGPKGQRRVPVAVSGERSEARSDHRSFVDRRVVAFLEIAQQPARRDERLPARILARDQQRQLERLGEADPSDLLRRRLRDEQVPALERSTKDCPWVALRNRRSSSPGPGRPSQSKEQLAGSSLLGEDTTRQCRLEKGAGGCWRPYRLASAPAGSAS